MENDSNQEVQGTSHGKSYKCTFCKRGFSNAQALGGHMNIHRKDRAKLKLPPSDHETEKDSMKGVESSQEDNVCTLDHDEGITKDGEAIKLQPLFAETPSRAGDRTSSSHEDGIVKDRKKKSGQGSAEVELDLELRLGPDPLDTRKIGTKDFL